MGAEVGGRLEQVRRRAPQPGDDVVVGDDDAERGVGDDERVEAEADAERERSEVSVRLKLFCRATAVTMPGRAIGRIHRNDSEFWPKKRKRCMAKAASVPSTRAMSVATAATLTEFHSASFGPSASHAARHQSSVSPCGGQASEVASLN